MNKGAKILSDIIVFDKYAQHIKSLQRRETFDEIVDALKQMHKEKYPHMDAHIDYYFENFVRTKKVVPSMRSMQFKGKAIKKRNARIFNCSALAVYNAESFAETVYLLLCGCGVGFSVQKRFTDQLPEVKEPTGNNTFVIPDSIEGWADAVKELINKYIYDGNYSDFDFSKIRKRGKPISTGGKAPGPEPLMDSMAKSEKILAGAVGRKLKPIEVYDIICHLSNAVMSGGVRRSALICLFDHFDEEMLRAKDWRVMGDNPQRYRSNNSAVLHRKESTMDDFLKIVTIAEETKTGEPAIFWTNDWNYLANPCVEISLRDMGFCNLTEINASTVESQQDLNQRAVAAAFIGTLQAGYTKFNYLRPEWEKNAKEEALLGVSLTGICSGKLDNLNLTEAVELIKNTNRATANMLGINPAHRLTCIKPSGTTSSVLGCSSGIHAWHSKYYRRNIRLSVDQPIAKYIMKTFKPDFWEFSKEKGKENKEIVFGLPVKANGGITRAQENVETQLNRAKKFHKEWIDPGHVQGPNKHNISVTVSVRDDEWGTLRNWMWYNREDYSAISVLPYDGGAYEQAPFVEIDQQEYNRLEGLLEDVEFTITDVIEDDDNTDLAGELACASGKCEL